jgi:hypothetical protein
MPRIFGAFFIQLTHKQILKLIQNKQHNNNYERRY